jgi:phage repressor protein C with HTH and peptisase S24 domain
MKSPKSSPLPSRRKPLLLRRVNGKSMLPTLKPGRVVLASGWFRQIRPEQVVVVEHQGLEKIKRIRDVRHGRVFVVGDNARASLDSRSFGWLPVESVSARIIWPRI